MTARMTTEPSSFAAAIDRPTSRPLQALLADMSDGGAGRRLAVAGTLTLGAFGSSVALLALAGWFLAASAVAGLAVTSTFSFLYPSAAIRALAVARTLDRYGERITTHAVTLDLVARMRTRLFALALLLPRERVAELRSADMLGRVMVDVEAVEHLLLRVAFPMLPVTAALAAAGTLAVVSPLLAVVVCAGLALTSGLLVVLAGPRSRAGARDLVWARAGARLALVELIDGLPELRSFGVEQKAVSETLSRVQGVAAGRRRLARIGAQGQAAGNLLADGTLLLVVLSAAGLLGSPRLSAPLFVLMSVVCLALFEPVGAVPASVAGLARARAGAARLTALFPGDTSTPTRRGYRPSGPWALAVSHERSEIVFSAAPADTVLLRGRSGVGKSTLLRAIVGEPAPGTRVYLAGAPVRRIDPGALVTHVTLVAQDEHVFDGTIRDNLLLARITATDDELTAALAAAALPLALDTPVGSDGTCLSGGQRRRLCVARGLLRRPDVLLLDEPTEGLDAATAGCLLGGVRAFLPRAVLVIALHNRQEVPLPWPVAASIDLG